MIVVVTCSLIALFLTFLNSINVLKKGMLLGFIIVTVLGAIHYNYGNDYENYYNYYKRFITEPFDLEKILSGEYFKEPGWFLLNYVFQYLGGFFTLVAVLNIIQNAIVYFFIKKYVEQKWWIFAVFTYLFTTSYYLLSFSMMRQMFVIAIFLGVWPFIQDRKWILALLGLFFCTFIHTSAYVLLPFAFWGFLPVKNSSFIGFVYLLILLILWFSGEALSSIFFSISNAEEFENYVSNYDISNNGMIIGLGFFIQLIPFFLSLYFLLNNNISGSANQKRLVALAAIHALIVPFGQIVPLVSRVGFYFGIYRIGSFPIIYKNIQRIPIRTFLIALDVLITLYDYFIFFNLETWIDHYSHFQTIFSALPEDIQ